MRFRRHIALKACPYCDETLALRAARCGACGRDLTRAPVRDVPPPFFCRPLAVVALVLGAALLLALIGSAVSAPLPAAAQSDPLPSFGDLRCRDEIHRTLERWDVAHEWRLAADDPTGARVLRSPTRRIGRWVAVRSDGNGSASVFLIEPARTTRLTWGAGCTVSETSLPSAAPPDPTGEAFTDAALERLLASRTGGVLYGWSPHMPLSVSGFREIERAVARLGLQLVPLLDPGASDGYARSATGAHALPAGALRTYRSVELLLRGFAVHTPAIQVFADGALVGPVIPGYRDARAYEAAIARVLGRP